MPAYGRADTLAESLESILGQTHPDFGLVIVDDDPASTSGAIVGRYAREDSRIHYERNATRLGMVKNWRRSFARACELYPRSDYFAWVSDHDFWHPLWLERLLLALEGKGDVVLAYPRTLKFHPKAGSRVTEPFDTAGVKDPIERVRLAAAGMFAGDMIYGLFRVEALERAGVFRPVLLPDRQVLAAVAALGEFRQVPDVLWYRQAPQAFSVERQRASFFTGRVPLHAYLPYHLQHWGVTMWDYGIRGRGGAALDRAAGFRAAAAQLSSSLARERHQREAARLAASAALREVQAPEDEPDGGDDR